MHKIQERYGRLQVLEVYSRKRDTSQIKERVVRCLCDCGNETTVTVSSVHRGSTKSCGCLEMESRIKHGLSKHPLYRVIHDMIRRCHTPTKEKDIKNYQGRGITVCDEWRKDKTAFIRWGINNGWKCGLTIERIDNGKGYNPSNCKFATYAEQNLNRRNNVRIEFNGETKTLTEWSKQIGVSFKTLQYRVRVGKFGKRIQ